MRILILGGTTEASDLASRLAADSRFEVVLSLAGRTAAPETPPVPFRIGGFGGSKRLASWLVAECMDAVVDATHPFAARISANAVQAVLSANIPLASIVRPAWQPQQGDRWTEVTSFLAAALALGASPRRVFLSVGRLELSAFADAAQHTFVARTIDPPGDLRLPPRISFVHDRGPFEVETEIRLLTQQHIDVVVSKNSGGAATYAKIEAARRLQIPVVMVARPSKPSLHIVADVSAAQSWLERRLALHDGSHSERGV